MSVLVAYATHSGATRSLAEVIADEFIVAGTEAVLHDIAADPDPVGHDAAVIGSGVRMDSLEKGLLDWAERHAAALGQIPVALFSCSGSAANPAKAERQKGVEAFLTRSPFRPVAVRNFPGWVLMDRIPLHERTLLRAMRTPVGDFRDLEAVSAWAREIRPLLRG